MPFPSWQTHVPPVLKDLFKHHCLESSLPELSESCPWKSWHDSRPYPPRDQSLKDGVEMSKRVCSFPPGPTLACVSFLTSWDWSWQQPVR